MATFTGDFTVTQNSESDITLTDTSIGADPTITSRTITIVDYQNNTFYTTTWNISDTSITLTDLLDKDYALNIRVDWNTPTPDPANVYAVTKLVEFDYYDLIFLGHLIAERMARYPIIVNDTNFMNNFFEEYAYIVCARISIGLMNDIYKGQVSLDLATYRRINQNIYF